MRQQIVQPAKDTRMWELHPDTNYGSSGYLALYDYGGERTYRTLLEFSLLSLPSGSKIISASLQSYYYLWAGAIDPVGKTTWAYKLTRVDWVELQATWNKYKTDNEWTAAGGDYVISNPSGGSTVFPSNYGWMSWNVKDIVKDAYDNDKPAEFLVKFETEGLLSDYSMPSFVSRDDTENQEFQPKLIIEYIISPFPTHFVIR